MKLYYSPGACSLAPHVALREIDADAELVKVNVAAGENLKSEFLAINERGRVPVLEVDGQIFTEAPAILVYLSGLKPDMELLPLAGSAGHLRCLEWLAWFSSSLHIGYAQVWRPERFLPAGSDPSAFAARGKERIIRMNAEIERRLSGPFLLGKTYSLADIYALPFYRWGYRIGLPMAEQCPRWTEWSERVIDRAAVRSAIEREGLDLTLFTREGLPNQA